MLPQFGRRPRKARAGSRKTDGNTHSVNFIHRAVLRMGERHSFTASEHAGIANSLRRVPHFSSGNSARTQIRDDLRKRMRGCPFADEHVEFAVVPYALVATHKSLVGAEIRSAHGHEKRMRKWIGIRADGHVAVARSVSSEWSKALNRLP